MDSLAAGIIGFFLAVILLAALVSFNTIPSVMEKHAEIFCNKDGQGLLEYDADAWHYENITCGGKPENTVIPRVYSVETLNTYDIFED